MTQPQVPWSFTASRLRSNRHVLTGNEEVRFLGEVTNTGAELGTVYVRILAADSYNLDEPLFDSHRDLAPNTRHTLRLVDIPPGQTQSFACRWHVPPGLGNRHLDIRMEVWNPHLLFNGAHPHRFFASDWISELEIVEQNAHEGRPKIFISYSWDSEEHRQWVLSLSEELRKHGMECILDKTDLGPGEDIALFMERGIRHSDIRILICSDEYKRKADNRERGVGYEAIISAHEYRLCPAEERSRFIPIVRNNHLSNDRKLPVFLGDALHIDMSGGNWRAEPMLDLLAAIEKYAT